MSCKRWGSYAYEKADCEAKGVEEGAAPETIPTSEEGRPDLNSSPDSPPPPPFALRINTPTLSPILGRKAFIRTTQAPLPSKASMGGHCICSEDNGFWRSRGRHDRSLKDPGCDSQEVNVCYHGIHQGEKLWNILKMQVHKLLMPGAAVALCNKILCLFSTVEYTYLSVPRERSLQCYPMNSLQMD